MEQGVASFQALIVDDNRQMRFLLRSLLSAGGLYRVSEAESAEEALAMMRRTPVDVVLVDWCMRPTDGIAFTRMVRSDPVSPNPYIPIIMVTAHSEKIRVQEARDAGVNTFLVKPVSTRMLFERVQFALNDMRRFVKSPTYFGPDRRFVKDDAAYRGPLRRASDRDQQEDVCLDSFDEHAA
ncbi:MAG: response regulator [Alphaproteobacteria bacterium]|nr:response regulator [Alphaproteobacteria bacterium]